LIVGGAVSLAHNAPKYGLGRGDFNQDEISARLFGAAQVGPFWGTLIGTYGHLTYDVTARNPG
jgi:hypothetical protein